MLTDVGDVAAQADVGDLGLGAARRTPREVHPDHPAVLTAHRPVTVGTPPERDRHRGRAFCVVGQLAVEPPGQLHRPLLGLDDREAAELRARACHHPALEGTGERRVLLDQLLGQQGIEAVLGHAGQHEVLVGTEADRAVAVGAGEAGRLDHLDPAHAADRDRAPHIEEVLAALGVHAHVVAAVPGREIGAGRHEGEPGALVQRGPEPFGAELLDQVPHAGQSPVLAVAELTEGLRDGPAQLDRVFGPNEHVEVRRHPFAVGESAAHQHVEPDRAVVGPGRPQADVVDLDPGAVLPASRHPDLELPGQVRVLPVAGEEVRDVPGHRVGVEHLVGVDPGDRAAGHVSGRVAAGLERRDPDVPQPLPDPRHVLDPDPVDLDVLAGGDVGEAVAEHLAVFGPLRERVGDHADLAELLRVQLPAGDLDPQHEGVAALALGVQADPLQPLDLTGG